MTIIKRIFWFLITNIAILFVLSIILSITGADQYITNNGLNIQTLLIFSLIIGFSGSFISLFLSKWMVKRAYNIRIIETPQNPYESKLVKIVTELANKSAINIPEIGIYESNEVNAFATGPSKNNALVAVSSALLQQMDDDELEGVLGHEISHIVNGDMVTLVLIQGVLNTFVIFLSRVVGYFVDKIIFKNDNENNVGIGYYITSFLCEIIFSILATIVVLYFSRIREFKADEGSSNITSTNKMIKALQKIKSIYQENIIQNDKHPEFATMKINNKKGWIKLFSTHPDIDERITYLQSLQNK